MDTWPIFICYRQADGSATATRIYKLLHEQTVSVPIEFEQNDSHVQLDVYFDQAVPGVEDWTAIHEPYLKRARAIIVICTPGSKLNEGRHDWVHREINWWLEHRQLAPILIDPLGEEMRYVPDVIAGKWPNAQRIKLIEKEWERLSVGELPVFEERVRAQLLGAISVSGDSFCQQELEQEKSRLARLQRFRRTMLGLMVAFIILAGLSVWIYSLKNAADNAAKMSEFDREQAEAAAAMARLARKQAENAYQLAQTRVLDGQADRAITESRLLAILQQFDKYGAYKPIMKAWQADFQTRGNALRAAVKDHLPDCKPVGGFSVYEQQLVEVFLESLPENKAMFMYLAVIPGSSPRPGDWAPAVLDVFVGKKVEIFPGRDLSRKKVKAMMNSVPVKEQWSLLIGLGIEHAITHQDQNYRISRTNIDMNDDGDMIMVFDICMEIGPKVNQVTDLREE